MVLDSTVTVQVGAIAALCGLIWNAGRRLASIEFKLSSLEDLPKRVAALEQEVAGLKSKITRPSRANKK